MPTRCRAAWLIARTDDAGARRSGRGFHGNRREIRHQHPNKTSLPPTAAINSGSSAFNSSATAGSTSTTQTVTKARRGDHAHAEYARQSGIGRTGERTPMATAAKASESMARASYMSVNTCCAENTKRHRARRTRRPQRISQRLAVGDGLSYRRRTLSMRAIDLRISTQGVSGMRARTQIRRHHAR